MRAARSWIVPSVAFLALTAFYVFFRIEMLDEGWYLQAGRLVFRGAMPYRDFAYFQAPFLPYLYGVSQQLSPGLLSGRLLAAAFAAGTWVLTLLAAHRLAGPRGVPIAAGAFLASIYLYSHYPIVLTYSPAAFFLAAAVYARLRGGAFLPVMLAAIAAGIRLSLLPAVLVLAIAAVRDSQRGAAWRVLAALVSSAALFAIFIAPDPAAAAFNLIGYHIEGATISQRLAVAGRAAIEALATAGIVIGAALLAPFGRSPAPHMRALTLLLGVCLAANLVPATAAPYYQSVLLPLLAALAAATLSRIRWTGLLVLLLVLHLAMQLEPARRLRVAAFSPAARPLPFEPRLSRLHDVAEDLRAATTPDSRIFTLATYFTVEADRDVMPGLEMSIFSVQFQRSRAECERTHTVNPDMLREWFERGAPDAVLLTTWELQYFGGRNGRVLGPLRDRYAIRKSYDRVGQFDGRAFLLTRLHSNGE